ncbi:MAG: hypothetical protein CEN91_271, partial [Candidatus Berkelbacteria bacterium Licking1014_85]
ITELIEFYTARKENDKQVIKLYLIGDIPSREIEQWQKSLNLTIESASFNRLAKTTGNRVSDSLIANLGLLASRQGGVNLLPQSESSQMQKDDLLLQVKHSLEFLIGIFIVLIITTAVLCDTVNDKLNRINSPAGKISDREKLTDKELDELKAISTQASLLPDITLKSAYLTELIDSQMPGISITEISINNKSAALKGSAQNRQSLLDYANEIKSHKIFTNVVIPLANYENNTDIPMEINFETR